MVHVPSGSRLRLSYLRSRRAIESLDQDRVFDDLFEDTPPGETPIWPTRASLCDYDHLVLASEATTDRILGLLGGQNGATGQETFLLLETGVVAAPARGQNLLRRMIAFAMLRNAAFGDRPDVMVALTRNPICCHVIRSMSEALRGTQFHPNWDETVVQMEPAALLQRIATTLGHKLHYRATCDALRASLPASSNRLRRLSREVGVEQVFAQPTLTADTMLALLDLRAVGEAALRTDALRLFRTRVARAPICALPPVERNPFWPAARRASRTNGRPLRI